MKRLLPLHIGWIAGLLLMAGCQQYKVHQPDSVLRLHLDQIQNDSQAAQVNIPLTRNLRQALANSPNVVLVNQGNADGSLKITLTSMERSTSARDSEDTGRPATFTLTLTAQLEWVESTKPSPWGASKATVEARAQAMAQPSLVDAEHQIMPSVINELTEKITNRILHPWVN